MKLTKTSVSNFVLTAALFGMIGGPMLLVPDAVEAKRTGSLTSVQKAQFQKEKVALRAAKTKAKRENNRIQTALPIAKRAYDTASRALTTSDRKITELSRVLEINKRADRDIRTGPSGIYTPSPGILRQQGLYDRAKALHDNGPVRKFNTTRDIYNKLNDQEVPARNALTAARANIATRKVNKDAAKAANLAAAQAAKAAKKAAKTAGNQQAGAIAQQVFPAIPAGVVPQGLGPLGGGIYASLPANAGAGTGAPALPAPLAPAVIYDTRPSASVFSKLE